MANDIPAFRFSSSKLSDTEAFDAWRQIMGRMFQIDKARVLGGLPRGGVSAFLIGDALVNRSVFNAQRLTRDRSQIEATPDHLVFQLYLSGGFFGEIGGQPVKVARGQVAICDLRQQLDVEAMTSQTFGLSIPRHMLEGVDLDHLMPRLDPVRERLLAARITKLHRSLPKISVHETDQVTANLVDFMRRLLDPSLSPDVLDGRELDADRLTIAKQTITELLASPKLSPSMIAQRLHMSRATLFRLFEPAGGVMQYVWNARLEAVSVALEQPSEPRALSRLAIDHGFTSAAHLSRSFRARYGATPRDWRAQQRAALNEVDWEAGSARLNDWWRALGR